MKTASSKTINIISIVVPILVSILLGVRTKLNLGEWTKTLPHINAIINSLTSFALIFGWFAIRRGDRQTHRLLMTASMGLGFLFLVFYVLYHISNPSTSFLGTGLIHYFYYSILISHILLSLIVLPLVLRAFYFAAFKKDFVRHKAIVKFAYPIWLYVSISGVIAYALISKYYV